MNPISIIFYLIFFMGCIYTYYYLKKATEVTENSQKLQEAELELLQKISSDLSSIKDHLIPCPLENDIVDPDNNASFPSHEDISKMIQSSISELNNKNNNFTPAKASPDFKSFLVYASIFAVILLSIYFYYGVPAK